VLTTQINARETVDPYLVGTQLNALSNQLQVAFSLTSQLHKLSLVNFL
jgi:flagellar hook-associated protein 3 FlgL